MCVVMLAGRCYQLVPAEPQGCTSLRTADILMTMKWCLATCSDINNHASASRVQETHQAEHARCALTDLTDTTAT
jgi:hypothetical protein